MKDFINWFIHTDYLYGNIFTLFTVLLSGLISLAISAFYFNIGNRENLRASVLYPLKLLLDEPYSWNNYKKIQALTKEYSMRYLKKSERPIIDNLISNYKNVCHYSYEQVCGTTLFSYFCNTLEKQGIELKIEPIYIEDELVDVDIPADLLCLQDDLSKIIYNYSPKYELETCISKVTTIFNSYCLKYYTNEKINFFEETSFKDIIETGYIESGWEQKFENMQKSKHLFLSLKLLN